MLIYTLGITNLYILLFKGRKTMNLEYQVLDNKYSTIKEVLRDYFNISDRLLTKLKKNEQIFLNNTSTYINHSVNINDYIKINLDFEEENENIVSTKMELNIIFEDEGLLIINKPAGIPVHPSILHYENSISNGVKFYYNSINLKRKIRPVNRLDKDTSGIVIFAKNEYIQESLIKQMKNKIFEKEYYAILEGYLEKKSGTINAPISRKSGSIIEREINENGELAITHFELVKRFEYFKSDNVLGVEKNMHCSEKDISNQPNAKNKLSLVKFKLETGRTHQIRVHSKYINHPILGDSLYGSSSNIISRQALHAYKVTFIHPIYKEKVILEIELPEDMKKIVES